MTSITVRNIPDDIMERIKALSTVDRRSLNNEILIILERGTLNELGDRIEGRKHASKSAQLEIWTRLLGTWDDN